METHCEYHEWLAHPVAILQNYYHDQKTIYYYLNKPMEQLEQLQRALRELHVIFDASNIKCVSRFVNKSRRGRGNKSRGPLGAKLHCIVQVRS